MKRVAFVLALIASALGMTAASGAKAALPFSQTGLISVLSYDEYQPDAYAISVFLPVFGFGGYAGLKDPTRTIGSYAYTPENIAFSLNIDGSITKVDKFEIVDEYWSDQLIYFSSGGVGGLGGSDFLDTDPGSPPLFDVSDDSINATITARETSLVYSNGPFTGGPGDYVLYQQSYRPLYVHIQFEVVADPGATYSISAVSVPEPATWAMMVLGLVGVGAALRSNRTKARLA